MEPAKSPSIYIIILNWNGCDDTLRCLKSLQKVLKQGVTIVVVDNGSTDSSVSKIQTQFPHVVLLENKKNLGFAEGNNVGIRYALKQHAEYIFLLNNDTHVAPSILDAFLTTFSVDPSVSILGGKIYLDHAPDLLDHIGGNWNQDQGKFDLVGWRLHPEDPLFSRSFPIDYVCGCALIAKANVFQTLGALEARYFLYWEDSDFCFRAKKEGFHIQFCPEAKLWHKGSASVTGGKPHSTYFWWRNRLLFLERNCQRSEVLSLYLRVIIPEISHIFKLYLLKKGQLFLLKMFRSNQDQGVREKRLKNYRAALAGVKDYCLRRFGNAPSWLF